jgi:hypothetical protein
VNTIWVGPEPLRRHFTEARDAVLVIDCGEPEPDRRIAGAGLFAKPFSLRGLEQADEKTTSRIVGALKAAGQPFSGQADKLSAKQEKAFDGCALVKKLSIHGTPGRRLLADIATRIGVRLEPGVLQVLHERAGHDPGRAVSVLEALRAGGYQQPTAAQIERLIGTSREHGLPWTLLSQLENGDISGLRRTLETAEAIPTIAFLAKRLTTAALVGEDPDLDAGTLSDIVGDTSDAALSHARKLAARLGQETCALLSASLLEADVHAKRSRGPEALALAVGHLRLALSRSGGGATTTPGV